VSLSRLFHRASRACGRKAKGDISRLADGDPNVDAALASAMGCSTLPRSLTPPRPPLSKPKGPCCARLRRCPDCPLCSSQATTGEVAAPSRMEQSAETRFGRSRLVRSGNARSGRGPLAQQRTSLGRRSLTRRRLAPPSRGVACRRRCTSAHRAGCREKRNRATPSAAQLRLRALGRRGPVVDYANSGDVPRHRLVIAGPPNAAAIVPIRRCQRRRSSRSGSRSVTERKSRRECGVFSGLPARRRGLADADFESAVALTPPLASWRQARGLRNPCLSKQRRSGRVRIAPGRPNRFSVTAYWTFVFVRTPV